MRPRDEDDPDLPFLSPPQRTAETRRGKIRAAAYSSIVRSRPAQSVSVTIP